ncbi:MAG: hypothetical protein HYV35_09565 [Lentisphaerae bacterium]|nr:hypothetical protein [Lentisphaerota bacterium]
MNAKERVRIAMRGGIPDRVPVLPQICPPHAVRVLGYPFKETIVENLRNPRKYDLLVAECARRYGVDGLRVWIGQPPKNIQWENGQAFEVDASTGEKLGEVDFMGGGGVVRLPERRRQLTDKDIEAIPIISAAELLKTEALAPTQQVIAGYGHDLFVVGVPGVFTLSVLANTEGMEAALMAIFDRPDFVKRFTQRHLEATIQRGIAMAQAGVDAIYLGETFGGFMAPEQFAELCLPYFQKFVEALKPCGVPIYLHMCGRVTHLLDLIVETGVDCLDPLDVIGGTPVEEVKRRIGGKLALMGGVNTVHLGHGTLEEVREDCRRCLAAAAPGGGYILAACDMLPTETDPEKVKIMLESAQTLGKY